MALAAKDGCTLFLCLRGDGSGELDGTAHDLLPFLPFTSGTASSEEFSETRMSRGVVLDYRGRGLSPVTRLGPSGVDDTDQAAAGVRVDGAGVPAR